MSLLIGLLSLFITVSVQASFFADAEAIQARLNEQNSCRTFIRIDSEVLMVGVEQKTLRVLPLDSKETIEIVSPVAIVDALRMEDTLWLLTQNALEEWNLNTRTRMNRYVTYNLGREMENKETPMSMIAYGDRILIAHGRLGLSIFSTSEKKIVMQSRLAENEAGHESMATGVAVIGNRAYVSFDSFTVGGGNQRPALRGIAVVDMTSMTRVAIHDGMEPGATAMISAGEDLFVSMQGTPIFKYPAKSFKKAKMPRPAFRTWKFPVLGSPRGIPAMDEKFFYTCFAYRTESGGQRWAPAIFERQRLGM